MTAPTPAVRAAFAALHAAKSIGGDRWSTHALALLGYFEALRDDRHADQTRVRQAECQRDAAAARIEGLRAGVGALLTRTDLDDPAALIGFLHAVNALIDGTPTPLPVRRPAVVRLVGQATRPRPRRAS